MWQTMDWMTGFDTLWGYWEFLFIEGQNTYIIHQSGMMYRYRVCLALS
jgi:hypothetical protein